jgi:hypothetical protein
MTERNNLDRLAGDNQSPPPQAHIPHQPNPPLQFSVPTEFVDLPSEGKYYPKGHPLHGKRSVEIKYMTAKEEDILASAALIKNGVVFDRFLQSILMDRVDPNDLLIGDKNALLIASRVTGYGAEYLTDVSCPSCSNTAKYQFNLSNTVISNEVDESFVRVFSVKETENGTFTFHLSEINATIEVRPLNGHDEKKLTSIAIAKNKSNLQESTVTDGLRSYIVSVNGNKDPVYINQFIESLPARYSRRIRIVYKNIVPQASIKSPFSCASCGYQQELEVPINIDFFWPDEQVY